MVAGCTLSATCGRCGFSGITSRIAWAAGGFLLFYLLSGLAAGAACGDERGLDGAHGGGKRCHCWRHGSLLAPVPPRLCDMVPIFFLHVVEIPAVFFLGFCFLLLSSVVHCRWRRRAPRPEAWPGGPTLAGLWWGFCGLCCGGGQPSGADGDMTMMTGRGIGPLIAPGTAEERGMHATPGTRSRQERLDHNIARRMIVGQKEMLVRWEFKKGALAARHSHPP